MARSDPHHDPITRFPRDYNAAADLLEHALQHAPSDKVAIVDDRGSYTYAQLAQRVNRAAVALRSLGVQQEQRVLMVMLDTVDFHSVFLGAMKIGAVPVPVNTLLTPDDYVFLLEDSRATALVVSDALHARLTPGIAAARSLKTVVVASSPLGGSADGIRLDALLDRDDSPEETAATTCDDVAFWLYSLT